MPNPGGVNSKLEVRIDLSTEAHGYSPLMVELLCGYFRGMQKQPLALSKCNRLAKVKEAIFGNILLSLF